MPQTPGLTVPPELTVLVVLGAMATAWAWLRARQRRERRDARLERADLARTISRFLDGALPASDLHRLVEASSEGIVWTVLESLVLRLDRHEWLRLSAALVGCRHAAAERRALSDDSPWRRVLACRRLALLRSRASWRALRRTLVRGPEPVTLAAATALARYRDRGALRWILSHPDALARRHRAAWCALLRAFGRKGLPLLVEALERGVRNPTLELAMIDALGAARAHAARPALEARLTEGGLDARTAAARALGLIQAIECGTSLIGALKDQAWQVRAQAARALGRVRSPLATHALAARLTDRSWWVRHHAAYALMELGEDGQAALRHVVATSDDPYARDMAREALEGGLHRLTA
jgi:HEAT repeat protein